MQVSAKRAAARRRGRNSRRRRAYRDDAGAPATRQGLARAITRRMASGGGRAADDLSDADFSAAVLDLTRLVTAMARLGKLEADAKARGPTEGGKVLRALCAAQAKRA